MPALVTCVSTDARASSSVLPTAANRRFASSSVCATTRQPKAVGATAASLSAHPPNWLLQARSASTLALASVGDVRTAQPPPGFQLSAIALNTTGSATGTATGAV